MQSMKESAIENYFCWTVDRLGGRTWKFTSPANRGVADRIACMPDGSAHFVELKRPKGGKVSALQMIFAAEMRRLDQRYAMLTTTGEIDAYFASISR